VTTFIRGDPLSANALRNSFQTALDRGEVYVTLDPNADGVQVPEALRATTPLVLKFSRHYDPRDLKFDGHGIAQTLSFAGNWFKVVVPWAAVAEIKNATVTHRRPMLAVVDNDDDKESP